MIWTMIPDLLKSTRRTTIYRYILTALFLIWCSQSAANGTGGKDAVAHDEKPRDAIASEPSDRQGSSEEPTHKLAVSKFQPQDLQETDPPEPNPGALEAVLEKVKIEDRPGGQISISPSDPSLEIGSVTVNSGLTIGTETGPEGETEGLKIGGEVIIQLKEKENSK